MDHTDQDFQHAPSIQDTWCWKLAKKDSIAPSRKLTNLEMIDLVNDLLKSTNPEFTPTGNAIIQRFSEDQIQNYF
jgi:DNA mismatch repair ATPase MutL